MSATSFIFSPENTGELDPNYMALYVYNGADGAYKYAGSTPPGNEYTGSIGEYVAAGQGFFVLALNDGVSFTFSSGMQNHNGRVIPILKSKSEEKAWPGLQLRVKFGEKQSSTLIVYNSEMTAGLDPGFDIGQLSAGPEVEIYTSLVEKDNSVNFAQQALPMTDFNKNIIPVGIDSEKGGEVTFSAFTVPLGNNRFWLEDRTTGIFTDLILKSYTVTLPAKTYGTAGSSSTLQPIPRQALRSRQETRRYSYGLPGKSLSSRDLSAREQTWRCLIFREIRFLKSCCQTNLLIQFPCRRAITGYTL